MTISEYLKQLHPDWIEILTDEPEPQLKLEL